VHLALCVVDDGNVVTRPADPDRVPLLWGNAPGRIRGLRADAQRPVGLTSLARVIGQGWKDKAQGRVSDPTRGVHPSIVVRPWRDRGIG
jgi:hypothetical protein